MTSTEVGTNNPDVNINQESKDDKTSEKRESRNIDDDLTTTSTTAATADNKDKDNNNDIDKDNDESEDKDIDSDNDDSGDEKLAGSSGINNNNNNNNSSGKVVIGKDGKQQQLSKKELKKLEKEEKERVKQEKERMKREEKERLEQEKSEKERIKREEKERQKLMKTKSNSGSNRSLKSMVGTGSSSSSLNLHQAAANESTPSSPTNKDDNNNDTDIISNNNVNNSNNNNSDEKDKEKEKEKDSKESTNNNDQDTNSSELDDSIDESTTATATTTPASPISNNNNNNSSNSPVTISSPAPASSSSSSSGDKREVVIIVTRAFAAVVHQNVLAEEGETKMRNKVINELINTEKDYIADLKVIIHVILAPLRESKLLTDKDINTIFSNIQMLLSVNEVLLADLEKTAKANQGMSIGPCFKYLADYLKIYSSYCANQQISHDHLLMCIKKQPAFKQFLDERQAMPECRQCHLDSFLIKPIQRLCKYPLLIRELIKNSVENHPDIESLEQAYSKIQTTVITVNENKRKAEVQQKMYKIHEQLETTEKFDFLTPTRYLIREDTLKELTEEKDKIAGKSHYFLFNDIIMRTKKDKKSIKLETLFVIASTTITDNESRGNTSFCNTFELAQVGSAGRKFTLVCDTYEQKMEWMTDIEQLIRPFQEEYTKEYEKLLDDFDPSKFKRSTIATGNPSAVDSSPKSLMRSATSSGLSTKHLPAVPSKPLPPPPPSHKSNVNLIRSESKSNLNDNNSANTTPNAASPRTSVANVSSSTDSPATTTTPSSRPPSISPRSSLTPPLETSPRTSLHLTTTTTTTTTSSPTTTAEATTTTAAAISKAPLPFIVKPKPPVTLPRKSLNSTNSPVLSSSEQSTPVLNPTTTSTPNIPVSTPLQKLPPRTTESSISSPAFSNFKPAPNVGGRPLPNPANMKPRALPHPTTTSSSPSSANTTPTHSPSLQSTNNNESTATTTTPSPPPKTTTTPTTSSPLVSSPSVNSSASSTPPPVAPRPIAFPKSAAALKNVVPSPVSRSYSTLPSSSSSFSPLSPSSPNSTAPAKDDNQLPAKKTVAPVLPPTQNINKLPPKTVTTAPVIPPRSSAPSTTDSSSNKPLPTPPPTSKPVPPPRR